MDLVSLETQEENDFFAEFLESSKAVFILVSVTTGWTD